MQRIPSSVKGGGFWALLVILTVGMISCTGNGTAESSASTGDRSVNVNTTIAEDSLDWFAVGRDGTHVTLREVIPSGSPAVLYFFAPG